MKLLLTTLITTFLLVACVSEDVPRNEGVSIGDPLPKFEVTLNNGKTISSESLRGKVAVIIFFSTTCQDCRRELPQLETVYMHFEGDDEVMMFAISREEKPDAIEVFWTEHDLTIPYSAQTDRSIYNLFATVGVPRIYIADRGGTIVSQFEDSNFPDSSTIIDVIESWELR